MLNFCKPSLTLALISALTMPSAFAATSGLLMNNDSIKAYYLSEANNVLPHYSRQQYSLMFSKEPDPRNYLLVADAELLDYLRPLKKGRSITPKITTFIANFHNQHILALGGGAIFRQPANDFRKYELLSELMVAPHISTHSDTNQSPWTIEMKWSWSFKLQVNYPLADNTELNFGFRTIQMQIGNQPDNSFETGLYIGLSSNF